MCRYDENKDESRHAAINEQCCRAMAKRNGWNLIRIVKRQGLTLTVDCVFRGKTEFPCSQEIELSEEDIE